MPNHAGWVAQLVEQRTENPCVGGSIPPPATTLIISGLHIFLPAIPGKNAVVGNRPQLILFISSRDGERILTGKNQD
jgi:hypothetical protein